MDAAVEPEVCSQAKKRLCGTIATRGEVSSGALSSGELLCKGGWGGEQYWMMEQMLGEIVRRCAAGERVALCVLVRTRGSTPQARGAKMLVTADGKTIGTLGGGCVEAEVRTRALRQLHSEASRDVGGDGRADDPQRVMEFRLDQDFGWDDGLICGGIMDVHVKLIDPSGLRPFKELHGKLSAGLSGELDLAYETASGQKRYLETFGPPPRLLIVGAGHVGQALATLAEQLDFRVVVMDDRPDCVSSERFPKASQLIVGEIEASLREQKIEEDTYVVIVTRGHKNDARALAAVVESNAKYIGLIGSKRKIKAIFDDLAAAGSERLSRVHAPIGLEIGAVTPAEIALSIAAELIAVRRGREDAAGRPMKMGREQLIAWVEKQRN